MKALYSSVLVLVNTALFAQPGQSGFVPVAEVPASEQLPAAPLVIAAYAFVWGAFLVYVWLMWRRLGRVERELAELSARIAKKR